MRRRFRGTERSGVDVQNYVVSLSSPPATSFRCTKAANSVDLDLAKKLRHDLKISADLETPYSVGLIVGASGSGKTTLARQIWGDDFEKPLLNLARPVIDQLPENWSYDDCAKALSGVGLTQVVCWVRPAGTLSNGQRARAEIALQMAREPHEDGSPGAPVVVDEWTSVVDRTVARVMSHTVQKWARKSNRSIVLLSCHYDVVDWLAPDWIIDCNKATYSDRRRLRCSSQEELRFDVRRCNRSAWKFFSRYHYLSERVPGGHNEFFGLFHGDDQIGFQAFSNYVPHRPGTKKIMHSNRVVIHPDYCGFGLGLRLTEACAPLMVQQGYRVMAKLSALPMVKPRLKNPRWRLRDVKRAHKLTLGGNMSRRGGFRLDVKTYSFEYVGGADGLV